jgi:hypothetical protein
MTLEVETGKPKCTRKWQTLQRAASCRCSPSANFPRIQAASASMWMILVVLRSSQPAKIPRGLFHRLQDSTDLEFASCDKVLVSGGPFVAGKLGQEIVEGALPVLGHGGKLVDNSVGHGEERTTGEDPSHFRKIGPIFSKHE